MERILLLADLNNFYASVEMLYNDKLRRVPMAVCGDPAARHGIILAKNDLAKRMGVITGESIYSAKQKAPNLTTITADYPKYYDYAKRAREIFRECSDDVTPFGLDEAWIDLTGKISTLGDAKVIADELRIWLKAELGLTASVGVSFNYIFSKLASDMKKPDATSVLTKDDMRTVIWNMPAFELLYVGKATRKKLAAMGILTIGDLARSNVKILKQRLGKPGETLWRFANGDDRDFDPKTPENDPYKSMGNTVTLPFDLTRELDILTMLFALSRTVSARLSKHKLKANCVSVLIKYGDFTSINRQITLNLPTDREQTIYKSVKRLYYANQSKKTVRSVGVHVSRLRNNSYEQLTLIDDEALDDEEISEIEENLKGRFKTY